MRTPKRLLFVLIGLLATSLAFSVLPEAQDGERPDEYRADMPEISIPDLPDVTEDWLRMPALSPDGETIAFVHDGDIWLVASGGGTARRVTVTEDSEWRPVFSPDGKWLAFRSQRFGNFDVMVMSADGGPARRLTYSDASDDPCCWLPDSSGIIFTSTRINSGGDLWVVRTEGGEPWPITGGGYRESEYEPAISSDGKKIVYVARGGSGAYRRRGYDGSNNNDLWLCDFDGVRTMNHRQLTTSNANETWPVFVGSNELLYVSFADATGGAKRVSHFARSVIASAGEVAVSSGFQVPNAMDVREPSFGGGKLVFSTGAYGGWKLHVADLKSGEISTPTIELKSDVRTADYRVRNETNASEAQLSPDGKKIAFIAGHDVYVMKAKSNAYARRVTETVGREWALQWGPDSEHLIATSDRSGKPNIFKFDLIKQTVHQLTDAARGASHGVYAPDGKHIIYIEDETRLRKMTATGDDSDWVVSGYFHGLNRNSDRAFDLSNDGKWITFTQPNSIFDWQVVVASMESGEVSQVSRKFGWCMQPRFSSDSERLLYVCSQEGSYDLYAVDIREEGETFEEDELDDLFKKEEEQSKSKEENQKKGADSEDRAKEEADTKNEESSRRGGSSIAESTEELFSNLEERTIRLTTFGESELYPVGASGDMVFFIGNSGGQAQVWKLKIEDNRATGISQVTKNRSSKTRLQLTADGKSLWYIDDGDPAKLSTRSTSPSTYKFNVRQRWKESELQRQSFEECIWVMDNYFYDNELHGLPWQELTQQYRRALDSVKTGDTWGSLMNDLFGELNSSHQRFYPRDTRTDGYSESIGRLGIVFDPIALSSGRYVVQSVVKDGPADQAGVDLAEGDTINSLNATSLDGTTPIASILIDSIGSRVILNVQDAETGESREERLKPTSSRTISNLDYEAWVSWQRSLVHKLSDGRLGYVHIRSMNDASVDEFKHQLGNDMEGKEGVIIDVRYNGGGRTAVDVLEIVIKRPWLVRTRRGLEKGITENVNRSVALEKPSCLMINYRSFSNAEILAEGFRQLEIGTIIGTPTGGGVIGTTSHNLLDGSRMRLPLSGAYALDGENLENNGRRPDIYVDTHPEELDAGIDKQTQAAVAHMLRQLDEEE